MDKKELQNLIDRISLTGPEGIKKIKKVLKELNDGNGGEGPSSGSMGEDEEYTIAQALNDLNERIKELQEQNAQQDYINIHVSSSLDAPSDFATEVFPILEEKMKQGCLLDCVLVDVDSTQFAKILTYETVDGNLYQVDYMYGGETRYIRADLE